MTDTFAIGVRHSAYHLALKRWREDMRYTQAQAAEVIGVDVNIYGAIERLQALPSRRVLDKFVIATDLAPETICPDWLRERFKGLVTSVETVHELTPLSLDDPTNRAAITAGAARTGMTPEDDLLVGPMRTALRADLATAFDVLKPRERDVIAFRFGLDGGSKRTLEEVAGHIGATRERARQIEQEALRKLRQPRISRRLRDYLDG